MFGEFSQRVHKVIVRARKEAHAFGHTYLGTEHLLLGLLGGREGVSAHVLLDLGVDPDEALQEAQEILRGRGTDQDDPLDRVPPTR